MSSACWISFCAETSFVSFIIDIFLSSQIIKMLEKKHPMHRIISYWILKFETCSCWFKSYREQCWWERTVKWWVWLASVEGCDGTSFLVLILPVVKQIYPTGKVVQSNGLQTENPDVKSRRVQRNTCDTWKLVGRLRLMICGEQWSQFVITVNKTAYKVSRFYHARDYKHKENIVCFSSNVCKRWCNAWNKNK